MSKDDMAIPTVDLPLPTPASTPVQKPSVPSVAGFEDVVVKLRQKHSALKWLKEEAEELKNKLRAVVLELRASTRFEDGLGGYATVSLPNYEEESARSTISETELKKMLAEHPEMTDLVSRQKSYILTGQFVLWMDTLLEQWSQQGIEVPEGLVEKTTTRLSVEGLKTLQAQNNEQSRALLKACLREPTVKVK